MRSFVTLLGCVLLSTAAYCQLQNATFRLFVNNPYIASVTEKQKPPVQTPPTTGYTVQWANIGRVKETYDTEPGIDLSFRFDAFSNAKFFINTGLTLQYYRYQRNLEIVTDPASSYVILPNYYGSIGSILKLDPRIGQTTAVYLQVPVAIGKGFFNDRIRIQVGVAPSVLLLATYYDQFLSLSEGSFSSSVSKATSSKAFTRVMMNGVFESSFSVTKRIGVNAVCQRSFSPIYNAANRPGGKAVFNSFSLGVSYRTGSL